MAQRITFFLALLVGFSLFSSCEHEVECFHEEGNEITPSALLTEGIWDLQYVNFTEYDHGQVENEWSEPFGPNTDNGECTFEFEEDLECTMIDVGGENTQSYRMMDDGMVYIGEDRYRVVTLTEDVLELAAFMYFDCEEELEGEEELMHFER